ncbi:putative polygalacturonase [Tetrabaena socialis]|uniref:Putative polygalacturonase n=1 Tax=Tetrabaena socialis TaxID=47790 RepID=A0A2J7ZXV7_9CHLO|nr:putative polygalacturonase [Tetrabaena socialis]|eukprot:PNH05100.1 putative polygalacturonase [Tetrabaena socialis]
MRRAWALVACLWLRCALAGHPLVCSPSDHGAVGDGRTLDTEAVVSAVAACQDGGVVRFRPGRYLLGGLTLSGSVRLDLPTGVQLVASAQREHYGPRQDGWYLLDFHLCSGCSLTGAGVVSGCAAAFTVGSESPRRVRNWSDRSCGVRAQCRPRLVGVRHSSGVLISGVTLRDSAFWTLHVLHSDHVRVLGVTVLGDFDFPNNDGIDIDGSSYVTVEGCHVTTADDAVCLKTTRDAPATHHVRVANCTLRSRSAAVKLGSETRADITDITFEHLQVLDSNRGLAIQLRDHGSVRNVTFQHISVFTRQYPGRWWGGGEPMYVTALPRWPLARVGQLANVTFRNVVAETRGGLVVVAGSPESVLRGVAFEDVRVTLYPPPELVAEPGAAADPADPGVKLDLRPGPYDVRTLAAPPAPFLVQFVSGLDLRNVTLELVERAALNASNGSAAAVGAWWGRWRRRQATAAAASGTSGWLGRLAAWWRGERQAGAGGMAWCYELVELTVKGVMAERVQVLHSGGAQSQLPTRFMVAEVANWWLMGLVLLTGVALITAVMAARGSRPHPRSARCHSPRETAAM